MATNEQLELRLNQLVGELHKHNVELASYTAAVKEHVATQKALQGRLDLVLDKHEERIGRLERWRESVMAVLPKRWLSTDQVEKRLDELEAWQSEMTKTLAKWAGISVCATVVIGIVLQVVLPLVSKFLDKLV